MGAPVHEEVPWESGLNCGWCNLRLVQRARLGGETPMEITPWGMIAEIFRVRHFLTRRGFDPLEVMIRDRVRGFIESLVEAELDDARPGTLALSASWHGGQGAARR